MRVLFEGRLETHLSLLRGCFGDGLERGGVARAGGPRLEHRDALGVVYCLKTKL